jgi:hypothetical protein
LPLEPDLAAASLPNRTRGWSRGHYAYAAHLAAGVTLVFFVLGAGLHTKVNPRYIGAFYIVYVNVVLVLAAAFLTAGTISFWRPRDKHLLLLGVLLWSFVPTFVVAVRINEWTFLFVFLGIVVYLLFAIKYGVQFFRRHRAPNGAGHYFLGICLLNASVSCMVVQKVGTKLENCR